MHFSIKTFIMLLFLWVHEYFCQLVIDAIRYYCFMLSQDKPLCQLSKLFKRYFGNGKGRFMFTMFLFDLLVWSCFQLPLSFHFLTLFISTMIFLL